MSQESLESIATLLNLWTDHVRRMGQVPVEVSLTRAYFQGKIDATWQIIDKILTEDEIKKIEALTGEQR